jgi:uncharacterized protein YkuJ
MDKVIRNNKVAVLYSPEFGAGWYSWNKNYPECLFLPEIVKLVEENKHNEINEALMKILLKQENNEVFSFYCGGAEDLEVKWLEKNTHFDINEYDGWESIVTLDDIKLIA